MRVIGADPTRRCICDKPMAIREAANGVLEWVCTPDGTFTMLNRITGRDIDTVMSVELDAPILPGVPLESGRHDQPNTDGITHRQRCRAAIVDILEMLAQQVRPPSSKDHCLTLAGWKEEQEKAVTGWFEVRGDVPDWLQCIGAHRVPIYSRERPQWRGGLDKRYVQCSLPLFEVLTWHHEFFGPEGCHPCEQDMRTLVLVRAHCAVLDRLALTPAGNIREEAEEYHGHEQANQSHLPG